MRLSSHIHEGLLNLFSAKLRSILALLGILVGTNEALKQFKTLGTDLLAITVNEASDQGQSFENQTNLTLSQAQNVLTSDDAILNVAPYTQVYSPIIFDGHEINGNVLGVTDQFAKIVHINLMQGRFVSLLDNYTFFCVIGHGIYDAIKKDSVLNPIGQQIQIGKEVFTIIGVANSWPENSFVYANIDYAVMVPILTSTTLSKYSSINNLILQLTPHADIDNVKSNISNYVNRQVAHKSLFFRSAKELITRMAKQSEILTVFLGLIGGVSLIVGGIGVMNIMLVSVVERKREIGIRLAVGARRKDIRMLFLVEAIMLSLVGGVLGVLIGMVIAYIIALFWHWQFTLFLLPPLIGFTVSAATGIFFGYYPAYKASQLDPIEALRSE
jgi:putative ABC transport system permease protein